LAPTIYYFGNINCDTKIILGEDGETNGILRHQNGVPAVAHQNVTGEDTSAIGTGQQFLEQQQPLLGLQL